VWQVAESDKKLIRYLLGDLSAEERDLFEDRYFQDDALHEQLLAMEEELIDAYVLGELSAEQVRSFEQFFLQSPERDEKVKLARALARFGEAQAHSTVQAPSGILPTVQRPERSLRSFFDFTSFRLQVAFAGAVLLGILVTFVIWQNGRQRQVWTSRPVLSFVLFPFYRGSGDGNLVSIPLGPHTIRLQMNLEADQYPSYRITVRAVVANNSIEKHGLKSRMMPEGKRAVIASFPSEVLPPEDYKLLLEGERSNGEVESVGSYGFRVERAQ
jgi:hypothetical protein